MNHDDQLRSRQTIVRAAELLALSLGNLVTGHIGVSRTFGEAMVYREDLITIVLSTQNRAMEIAVAPPLSKLMQSNASFLRDAFGETIRWHQEMDFAAPIILGAASHHLASTALSIQTAKLLATSKKSIG